MMTSSSLCSIITKVKKNCLKIYDVSLMGENPMHYSGQEIDTKKQIIEMNV